MSVFSIDKSGVQTAVRLTYSGDRSLLSPVLLALIYLLTNF